MIYRILGKLAPVAAVAAALMLGQSAPAGASLIGDTITIFHDYGFPPGSFTATDNVVVGAGVELSGDGTNDHSDDGLNSFLFPGDFIDVAGDSISYHFGPAGFTFLYAFTAVYSGLDWLPTPGTLDDVTLQDTDGKVLAGFQFSNITASGFEFQGTVDITNGANFSFLLDASHEPPTVPEPATVWMFLMAIGALGAAGVRQRLGARYEAAA